MQTKSGQKQIASNMIFALLIGAAGLLGTATAYGQTPPPGSVKIKNIKALGSACKNGKVVGNLSPDSEALTLLFSDFIVEATDRRSADLETCLIDVRLDIPPGWSYAIFSVDVRGFVSLDDGLQGKQRLVLNTPQSRREREIMTFNGPLNTDYTNSISIPITNRDWSPCRRTTLTQKIDINVTASVRRTRQAVRDRSRPLGLITVDSIDGYLSQQYQIAWTRCNP